MKHHSISPTDSITFSLDLSILPLLCGFIFLGIILVLHLIYFFQDRFSGLPFPIFSELGTGYPNSIIYAVSISIEGFLSSLCVTLFTTYCEVWELITNPFVLSLEGGALLLFFGVMFSASVTIKEQPIVHAVLTILVMILIDYAIIATFIFSRKVQTRFLYISRFIMIVFISLCTLFQFISPLYINTPTAQISSITRLFYYIICSLYIMTWKNDMSNISVEFVIEDTIDDVQDD